MKYISFNGVLYVAEWATDRRLSKQALCGNGVAVVVSEREAKKYKELYEDVGLSVCAAGFFVNGFAPSEVVYAVPLVACNERFTSLYDSTIRNSCFESGDYVEVDCSVQKVKNKKGDTFLRCCLENIVNFDGEPISLDILVLGNGDDELSWSDEPISKTYM